MFGDFTYEYYKNEAVFNLIKHLFLLCLDGENVIHEIYLLHYNHNTNHHHHQYEQRYQFT